MAHHHPVDIDPKEISRANAMWHNFTRAMTWSVVGVVGVLVLLGLVFIV